MYISTIVHKFRMREDNIRPDIKKERKKKNTDNIYVYTKALRHPRKVSMRAVTDSTKRWVRKRTATVETANVRNHFSSSCKCIYTHVYIL